MARTTRAHIDSFASQVSDLLEADRHCMTCGHDFNEEYDRTTPAGDLISEEICPACGSDDTLIATYAH